MDWKVGISGFVQFFLQIVSWTSALWMILWMGCRTASTLESWIAVYSMQHYLDHLHNTFFQEFSLHDIRWMSISMISASIQLNCFPPLNWSKWKKNGAPPRWRWKRSGAIGWCPNDRRRQALLGSIFLLLKVQKSSKNHTKPLACLLQGSHFRYFILFIFN